MPVPNVPHVSPALARSARDHFQPLYATPLTEEDGREIATNVLGVFAILKEWRDKRDAAAAAPPVPAPPSKAKRRRSSMSNPE